MGIGWASELQVSPEIPGGAVSGSHEWSPTVCKSHIWCILYIYIYIFISFHRYHRYLMFRLSILCSILFYLFSALLVAHHPILTSKTTVISPFPSQASHIVANISPHVHLVQPNILFLYSRQGYYPMVIYQFAIINGPWLPQLCVKLPEGNMLNVGKTLRNQPYVDA